MTNTTVNNLTELDAAPASTDKSDAGPLVGVAWNVRIMACKFLDASGSGGLDDAIECIEFAQQNGAHIFCF